MIRKHDENQGNRPGRTGETSGKLEKSKIWKTPFAFATPRATFPLAILKEPYLSILLLEVVRFNVTWAPREANARNFPALTAGDLAVIGFLGRR